MSFLCLINYQDKIIPRSSNLILDERGITILGTNNSSFYQKDNLIIVGNGDLNNKKHLSSKLNLSETADLSQIIMNGYQRAGQAFFDQLDGRFSFCIIDISNKSVIGIRDHFGLQNLYFQHLSDSFLISDDIQEIINVSSPVINTNAVISYFDFEQNNKPYSSETLFQNIHKVLPAHYVSFSDGKFQQNIYWQPSIEQYKDLTANEQISIFKKKLIKAVEKNISPEEKICTNLSGGLDSSSISCIVKQLGVSPDTIYFSSGHSSTDESYFAQKVTDQYNLSLHEANPVANPFLIAKQTIEICKIPDMLFMPISSFFSIAAEVQQLNSKKILTGDGGDSVVAYGNEYLFELYEQQNWRLLKQSIESYVVNRDLSFYFENWHKLDTKAQIALYSNYFYSNIITKHLRNKHLKKALQAWHIGFRYFNFSHISFFKRILDSVYQRFKKTPASVQLLNENYLEKTTDTNTAFFDINSLTNNFTAFQKEHLGYSFSNLNIAVIEQQNAIMNHFGIKAIHPFFDKELIEISIAISSETRFDNGLGRGTLRQAMKGILPEEVRLRTTKIDFSEYFFSYFESLWSQAKTEIPATHKVWKFVRKSAFDKLIIYIFESKIPYQKKNKSVWLASRTIYLALWLDFFDNLSNKNSKQ